MEVWKPVNKYEGIYEISNTGKVKAIGRLKYKGRGQQWCPEIILKNKITSNGYLQVVLCKNKERYHCNIHRIVATAFIPNPNNKPTVNHKDGNKWNNNPSNLEWATNKEQINHADATGLRNVKGEGTKNSKLTNEAVFDIRSSTLTTKELAKKYSVNKTCIYKVAKNLVWRHLL